MRRWFMRAEGTALAVTLGMAVAITLAAALVVGGPAAGSALLGAGDVFFFFTLGALAEAWALRRGQLSGVFTILASYGLRIVLLTAAALALVGTPLLASPVWFAAGAAVATLAWPAGLVLGHLKGRWPIYDPAQPVTAEVGR